LEASAAAAAFELRLEIAVVAANDVRRVSGAPPAAPAAGAARVGSASVSPGVTRMVRRLGAALSLFEESGVLLFSALLCSSLSFFFSFFAIVELVAGEGGARRKSTLLPSF